MKKNFKITSRRQAEKVLPFSLQPDIPEASFLELVVELGKKEMHNMIDGYIDNLCGERYKHNQQRQNTRWSKTNSELIMGGRRVSIEHSRVRDIKNRKEVQIKELQDLKNIDLLRKRQLEQMIIGVSTRKYERSLETLNAFESRGTSKSAVSRGFILATTKRLHEWLNKPIQCNYPFIMIDGIGFKKKTVVVALGINENGAKTVLGAWLGSTENARVCTDLLQNLIDRGLNTDSVKLVIMDGGKAIHRAVSDVFGDVLIQRCQVHKKRNIQDYLPDRLKESVSSVMTQAYSSNNYEQAKKMLDNLAESLKKQGESKAASSLLEGLEETLTLVRLNAPFEIRKSLSSTNVIENMNGLIRITTNRVRKWKDEEMIMRWVSSAIMESEKSFRRVKGYKSIPILLDRILNMSKIITSKVA